MAAGAGASNFALDEELWFGDREDAEAERKAAASLAAVGARIVGAKPFPIAARRLDELTRNPNTRIEQVVGVLESDPALSARLLRLVNSAGYGLKVRCTSVRHAAVLVGTRRLNQVATTAAILDLFDGTGGVGVELLEHAAVVGSLCRYLAVHLGLPHDELFTCGFLHDIGKLMLLDAERERYAELLQEFGHAPDQMHLAERRLFGFDHAVLGAHVLAAWNIPEPVPRVIAWHHSPARALQDTVLAGMVETLRLADLLAYVLPLADTRLAIELAAAGDAAQYLEISEAQLAAMWPDLLMLLERSRARSHGEPELGAMVPKVDVPNSFGPKSSRGPASSAGDRAARAASRPVQEVPAHFPCSVCGKPSYGNACAACGGQICPEHQVGPDEWCTHCAREYPRFKKTYRPTLRIRIGAGLLVGTSVAIAVVSAARNSDAGVAQIGLSAFIVLALWAVVLPVAYRLWYRLLFLETRRKNSALDVLPVARPQSVSIRSVLPKEAMPTMAAPPGSSGKLPVVFGGRPDSEPSLSVAPLSMAPLSMAPQSVAPRSLSPQPFHSATPSLSAQSVAPQSISAQPVYSAAPSLSAQSQSLPPHSISAPSFHSAVPHANSAPAPAHETQSVPSSEPFHAAARSLTPVSVVAVGASAAPTASLKASNEPSLPSMPVASRFSRVAEVEEAPVSSPLPVPTSASALSQPAVAAAPSLRSVPPRSQGARSVTPVSMAPRSVMPVSPPPSEPSVSELVPKPAAPTAREPEARESGELSEHSGAHPLLRFAMPEAFNSPLPAGVAAYGSKPLNACVCRPPLTPSQLPKQTTPVSAVTASVRETG